MRSLCSLTGFIRQESVVQVSVRCLKYCHCFVLRVLVARELQGKGNILWSFRSHNPHLAVSQKDCHTVINIENVSLERRLSYCLKWNYEAKETYDRVCSAYGILTRRLTCCIDVVALIWWQFWTGVRMMESVHLFLLLCKLTENNREKKTAETAGTMEILLGAHKLKREAIWRCL